MNLAAARGAAFKDVERLFLLNPYDCTPARPYRSNRGHQRRLRADEHQALRRIAMIAFASPVKTAPRAEPLPALVATSEMPRTVSARRR